MKKAAFVKLRKKMGLNQADLAHELGVSRAAVSRWESGKRKIDSILALALDCLAERRTRETRRKRAKSRK